MSDNPQVQVEDGPYGKDWSVTTAWDDSIREAMEREGIRALTLNYAQGWRQGPLTFLRTLPFLDSLTILSTRLGPEDAEEIYHLPQLRALSLTSHGPKEFDFSRFPKLERCFFLSIPRSESIFQCPTLRRLYISGYKGRDTEDFAQLPNLIELRITNGPTVDLKGLARLRKLRRLDIAYLRKLDSLEGIEGLTELDYLDIANCGRIANMQRFAGMMKLRQLGVTDCGEVESLGPLTAIESLMRIALYTTKIVDGDLSPLMGMPNLVRVGMQFWKHYRPKKEEVLRHCAENLLRTRNGERIDWQAQWREAFDEFVRRDSR